MHVRRNGRGRGRLWCGGRGGLAGCREGLRGYVTVPKISVREVRILHHGRALFSPNIEGSIAPLVS